MAECLVTKLKSVVNNDNLLKLGEIRVEAYGAITIESIAADTFLKCITGTFEDGTTEKTVRGYASFNNMTNPSIISIMPKYNLSNIGGWNGLFVDLKELKYCYKLTRVGTIKAIAGSLKDVNEWIAASNITSLTIYTAEGFEASHIESLSNLKAVINLELRNTAGGKITLNLENLPNLFPNIKTLKLFDINIEGNISELILPSTCTSCTMRNIPATLTGSKATFLANNPQITTADFSYSSGITE